MDSKTRDEFNRRPKFCRSDQKYHIIPPLILTMNIQIFFAGYIHLGDRMICDNCKVSLSPSGKMRKDQCVDVCKDWGYFIFGQHWCIEDLCYCKCYAVKQGDFFRPRSNIWSYYMKLARGMVLFYISSLSWL